MQKTNNKQILFYSPYPIFSFHFETELELAEKYLKQGHNVTFLVCNGELPSCDPNPYHKYRICAECKSRLSSGFKWIGKDNIKVENFYRLTSEQKQIIEELNSIEITSWEFLKQIFIDGSDIGMAAFGSVVCNLRDPEPDLQTHIDLVKNNLIAATIVHYSLKNRLGEDRPDRLIIFNGRMSSLRPALRLAQSLHIEVYVHERSGDLNRYYLVKNVYPHDIDFIKQEIELTYENSPLSETEKLEVASQWFEERINNHPQAWFSFTENQTRGLLPKSFDLQKTNIAVFNSSEDEMVSIEGWQNPLYKNQNDAIYKILNEFKDMSSIRFFLRIHPNLSNVNNSQTRFLEGDFSEFKNLEIIPAESPVSTYTLIDKCDLIITFGSTVGIEAVYHNKPSILLGRAIYEDLGGVILPKSHADLANIIQEYSVTNKLPITHDSKTAFIKYGFFQKKYGEVFEYAKPYNAFKVSMQRLCEKEYFGVPI